MKYKLGQLGTVYSGGTPSTKNGEFWDGDIAWITPKDLAGYSKKKISKGERNITDAGLSGSSANLIPAGSVLMSSRAPIGYVAIANNELSTNQGFKSINCDERICLNEYIYYWIKSNIEYIKSKANGSTFKEISGSSFKNLDVDVPDLEAQKKTVHILSALDQKIELNNNESNTLQSIIDTQYRKVFSENENNNKVKASDLFDYEGGYSYTSAELADESDIGMMTIKNFERTGGFKADGFKALSPKKGTFKTAALYDIFISCTDVTQNADIIGNAVMLLDTDKYSTVTYSMDLVRIIPKINRFALYAILSSKDFKSFALGYKSGTTVLHLNKKCLAEYEIALPDEKSLDVFGATIEKACKKIAINLAENGCLSQIRDSLLPKLMSGDVNLDKVTNE